MWFVASLLFTLSFINDAYHPYTCVRGFCGIMPDFSLLISFILFLHSEAKVYFKSFLRYKASFTSIFINSF